MKSPPPVGNRLFRRYLRRDLKCTAVASLPSYDPWPLDALLFNGGEYIQPLPASLLHLIPQKMLQSWCQQRARYTLPTVELIEVLGVLVANRPALEICSGCGDLGFALDIRMTDSDVQRSGPQAAMMQATLQRATSPTKEVEIIDALHAVEKYQPQVVIASFATQLYRDGDTKARIGSSIYGVDEEALLDQVRCYIHIGNDNVTSGKRILTRPHKIIRFAGLVTRAFEPSKNAIRVWGETPNLHLPPYVTMSSSEDERRQPTVKRKFVQPRRR